MYPQLIRTEGTVSPVGYSLKFCTVLYGLLVLEDYDVFLKRGVNGCSWVELYLDGEAFVLTVTTGDDYDIGTVVVCFAPEEEAALKGLSGGKDIEWRSGECEESVWRSVLEKLEIKDPLNEVLHEISEKI